MTDTNIDPDYAWWRAALAGERPEAVISEPQCGYYISKFGADRRPVAIWRERGRLSANIGFAMSPIDASEAWVSCYSRPTASEDYWAAIDAGGWPDTAGLLPQEEPEPQTPGERPASNQPADTDPKTAIEQEIDNAIAYLESNAPKNGAEVRDQAIADALQNTADRLNQLWKKADDRRKVEKKPHDDAAAQVQERWRGLLSRADGAKERATALVKRFLKWKDAENARIAAEKEAARRKLEDQQRREAEEAAAAGREPPPVIELPAAEPPPAPARVGGAISGRRTSAKANRWWAEITDYPVLLDHLKDHEAVREAVQSIANAAARSAAHTALPGTVVKNDMT